MEIEKQVFTLFASFLKDLGKTYPEIKNCLYRNYEDVLTDNENKKMEDLPKLKLFLDCIYENQKLIKEKDVSLFDLEIEFLEDISFKKLWTKNITDKTKETIWKYFQTFSLITINLKSSEELQNALCAIQNDEFTKDDIKDKQTVKELKKLKELTSELQKPTEEEKGEGEFDLDTMLGGLMDSNIGNIAKEVAESMNMENIMGEIDENSNPMEIMAQLMNPEKMGSIFQNIDTIMKKKLETGELSEDSLKEEAEGMVNKMSDNPLFGNLMQQMDPEKNKESQGSQGSQESQESQGSQENKELKKEIQELKQQNKELDQASTQEKRDKLRQKIDEKKKNRTNQ